MARFGPLFTFNLLMLCFVLPTYMVLSRLLIIVVFVFAASGCKSASQAATNNAVNNDVNAEPTPVTASDTPSKSQTSSSEESAPSSQAETPPLTSDQKYVVTSYPWNWPREGAPDFSFLGKLEPASAVKLFSDYLKEFKPRWGEDWDTERKREYLLGLKFIGQITVWWQENLCYSKETPAIYEFSFNTNYYASEIGAQQFVSAIKGSFTDFKATTFPNRAMAKSHSTATWNCDANKINLDINQVTILLHKRNVSTFIYLASPNMSPEDMEKQVMKFADEYESWIDKSAVPLTKDTEFEVPVELAFYNTRGNESATGSGSSDITKAILGTWKATLSYPPTRLRHSFTFSERGGFAFERGLAEEGKGKLGQTIFCDRRTLSEGNYQISGDKLLLYPSKIELTTSNDCEGGADTTSIEATGPTTLTVSVSTSAAVGGLTTVMTVCNPRAYEWFEKPDLFAECIWDLVKQ